MSCFLMFFVIQRVVLHILLLNLFHSALQPFKYNCIYYLMLNSQQCQSTELYIKPVRVHSLLSTNKMFLFVLLNDQLHFNIFIFIKIWHAWLIKYFESLILNQMWQILPTEYVKLRCEGKMAVPNKDKSKTHTKIHPFF